MTKFDTSTNPCTVHCIWEKHEDNDIGIYNNYNILVILYYYIGSYTCLSLYELVLDNVSLFINNIYTCMYYCYQRMILRSC